MSTQPAAAKPRFQVVHSTDPDTLQKNLNRFGPEYKATFFTASPNGMLVVILEDDSQTH
jgi:hypothetical protein